MTDPNEPLRQAPRPPQGFDPQQAAAAPTQQAQQAYAAPAQGYAPPQGFAAPQPPQGFGGQPGVPGVGTTVLHRGVKPWVWWVMGGAMVFIALVVVLVVVLLGALNGGARSVAQQYLGDIARGDAHAAGVLARVDTSDKNSALLTNAVLGAATERITAPTVVRTVTSSSSDLTYVYVGFRLDGKNYRSMIQLDKDSKGWYVEKGLTFGLPYLSDSSALDVGYSLKGATVAVTTDSYQLQVYPGVYALTAPNEYYTLKGTATATAAPDAPSSISGVTEEPSQKYIDAVQQQIDAHFDKCAAMTDYYDIEDCGIELGYPDNVQLSGSTVTVKVGDYPKVAIDDSDSGSLFKLDGGSFSATITGSTWDGGKGTESIQAGAGYTGASIQIKDGKVVVTFD